MFSGIIEEVAKVTQVLIKQHSIYLSIQAKKISPELKLGDSVAVNGVCLTVVKFNQNSFSVDVMPSTFMRTNLRYLVRGDLVNLERALQLGSRFDGHIVSGHIDDVGSIWQITKSENSLIYEIKAPQSILAHCILQGSIAIDGISLTISALTNKSIIVNLIPHTQHSTSLSQKKVGGLLNLECDILAKQIHQMCKNKQLDSSIDYDFLSKCGYL